MFKIFFCLRAWLNSPPRTKIKKIENDKNYKIGEKEIQKDLLVRDITKLDAQVLTIVKKVNTSGTLFEKVTAHHIGELIVEHFHVRIPEQYISHRRTYQKNW
jgi:ribosomal protein L9